MTQLVGVGCAAVLCLSAWGYEWPAESSGDIVFGSPDAPIDGGEVVAPENAAVTSFTAYLKEGETLNVTGGPVALADGAAITNTLNAKVSFAADVAAAGAFEIGMPLELVTKTDAYCDSTTGKILFEGLDLDDYAVYDGGLIGSSQNVPQGLFVCQEERSPGRYEFQLQYDFGAEYQLRIAAKVRLVQEGADVRGYVLWCKYAWYMPNVLGYEHYGLGDDFEAIDPDWLGSYNIALAPDQSHLGLASLTLVRRQTRADAGVAFAGKLTGSGTIAVAKQARAILPYTCLPSDGRFANNLSLAGDLCVGGIGGNITLANAVEWKGGRLVLDDMAFGGEPVVDVYTTLTADQLATYNAWGKITAVQDASVADLEIVDDGQFNVGGRSAKPYWFEYNPESNAAEVQFQAAQDEFLMGNRAAFSQSGSDIQMGPWCWWYHFFRDGAVVGEDMRTSGASECGSYNLSGNLTLKTKKRMAIVNLESKLALGGRLVVGRHVTANVIPDGFAGGSGREVRVQGKLVVKGKYAFDSNTALVLEGGQIDYQADQYDMSYYNGFTSYGGTVTGSRPWWGGLWVDGQGRTTFCKRWWKFVGFEPTYIDSGVFTVNHDLLLEVTDVTGDDQPDLYIRNKGWADFGYSEDLINLDYAAYLSKTGPGTCRVEVQNTLTGTFTLREGTLELAVDNAYPYLGMKGLSGGGFLFSGGTLALADGTTQNLAYPIRLLDTSTVKVGTGAKLTVVDCSEANWTDGKRLDFVGDVKAESVYFGPNGLTARQQRMLYVNGKRAALTSEGYLVRSGMSVLVK